MAVAVWTAVTVTIYGVDSAGSIGDLPYDHGGDLDRVALGVVDLGLRRFLVADRGVQRSSGG